VSVRLRVDTEHLDGVLGQLGSDATLEADGDDADEAIVTVTVTNRAALRSFVLGFLEHVEVIEPEDVRADIVAWLEHLAARAGASS
jgi:predicted DNA-binding transcriptional regulator YafY